MAFVHASCAHVVSHRWYIVPILIQQDKGLVQHKSGLAKHILKLQDLKQVRRLTDVAA